VVDIIDNVRFRDHLAFRNQTLDFFVCNIQMSGSFVLGVNPAQTPVSWLAISPYRWITGARRFMSIFSCSQKFRVAPARAALYTPMRISPMVIPFAVSEANITDGRSKGSSLIVIDDTELGSNAGSDSQWKYFFPLM